MMVRRILWLAASALLTIAGSRAPAQGQQLQVQPQTVQRARLRTSLHVGSLGVARGQKANLYGLLLDARNRPIAGARVDFRVRWTGGSAVCTARTDSSGRAQCDYQVPMTGYSFQYEIIGRFLGDPSRAPSEARNVLQVENGIDGGLRIPGGVDVSVGLNEALEGHRRPLRARVTRGGVPVTRGRVWFTANGVPLGEGSINAVGVAHLYWTPQESELSKLYLDDHVRPGMWIGNLQAWYVPPQDGELLPGVGIGELWVGRWDPCASVRQDDASPCSVADATGMTYRVAGRPMVTVYRDRPGEDVINRGAAIVLSVPEPPELPPNADCDVSAWGMFGSVSAIEYCSRTCMRVRYFAMTQSGGLEVQDFSGGNSCDWRLSRTLRTPRSILRRGRDRCALRAAQLGITTWNHTADVVYEIPILAVFDFRDPHLVRVSGGWEATLLLDAQIRYARVRVTASVNCR